ncbi:MAG: metallophosphoesterase [Phycisphaeraceae bacterium]|nr:MAG: metallophosphoesterase [Phycisphaeraceae bacterium]
MARIGLIADIHANREALEAVLADVPAARVDRLVCLGDIVGYGPDPEACVDLVEDACDIVVLGNHDEAVLVDEASDALNDRARVGIAFTRSCLTPWHMRYLRLLPYRADIEGLAIGHGSFARDRFDYLYTSVSAGLAFRAMEAPTGAVGHTHLPSAFTCRRDDAQAPFDIRVFPLVGSVTVKLPEDRSVIVNPGSVGQPRDRNPHASWGILDTDVKSFEIRRVPYDIEAVSYKIRNLGLPAMHGERLKRGA